MLQETEHQCLVGEKFKKGHKKGFTNTKFDLIVGEEVDI